MVASDCERVTDSISCVVAWPNSKTAGAISSDDGTHSTSANAAGAESRPTLTTTSPHSSSSSDRQTALLTTGEAIPDKYAEPGSALDEIVRRHREQASNGAGVQKKQEGPTPLPVSGRIGRRRRRTRSRPPNADARRCPSPGHDNSTSFWRNGCNQPNDRPAYKCIDCRVWYSFAPQYHNHLASHVHEFNVRRGSQVYWCGICRRTLLTSNDFNIHLAVKTHWASYAKLTGSRQTAKLPKQLNQMVSAADCIPVAFRH